jgi:hypothetical protein
MIFTRGGKSMSLLRRFRINKPTVVYETFGKEVVIIAFDSGNYYNLNMTGTDIWNFIESGSTVDEIIERIIYLYEGNRSSIENAVNKLIDELLIENLIIPQNSEKNTQINTIQVEPNSETKRYIFEPPHLQKYTDVQELLLLDPIHEVNETGWPNIKLDSPLEIK